jgi:hypothetical protein
MNFANDKLDPDPMRSSPDPQTGNKLSPADLSSTDLVLLLVVGDLIYIAS